VLGDFAKGSTIVLVHGGSKIWLARIWWPVRLTWSGGPFPSERPLPPVGVGVLAGGWRWRSRRWDTDMVAFFLPKVVGCVGPVYKMLDGVPVADQG
jgi:hypothetical protein